MAAGHSTGLLTFTDAKRALGVLGIGSWFAGPVTDCEVGWEAGEGLASCLASLTSERRACAEMGLRGPGGQGPRGEVHPLGLGQL